MWTEVVADDRVPYCRRVERARVAAEGEQLGAALASGDVAVELVPIQVEGGEQVPRAVRAGVGRPPAAPPRSGWIPLAPGRRGPLLARMWFQVQRPEFIDAEDHARVL